MNHGLLTLGLVLTLDPAEGTRDALAAALLGRSDVTCGELNGQRLPLALQTQVGCDREAIAALQALPGVVFCDVVYVHLQDCEDAHEHALVPLTGRVAG